MNQSDARCILEWLSPTEVGKWVDCNVCEDSILLIAEFTWENDRTTQQDWIDAHFWDTGPNSSWLRIGIQNACVRGNLAIAEWLCVKYQVTNTILAYLSLPDRAELWAGERGGEQVG